jgi:hypothetical protein
MTTTTISAIATSTRVASASHAMSTGSPGAVVVVRVIGGPLVAGVGPRSGDGASKLTSRQSDGGSALAAQARSTTAAVAAPTTIAIRRCMERP